MLGIWEYFWDIVDWSVFRDTTNICRATALMAQQVNHTGVAAPLTLKIGEF